MQSGWPMALSFRTLCSCATLVLAAGYAGCAQPSAAPVAAAISAPASTELVEGALEAVLVFAGPPAVAKAAPSAPTLARDSAKPAKPAAARAPTAPAPIAPVPAPAAPPVLIPAQTRPFAERGGVGIVATKRIDGAMEVRKVVADSPAARAGVRAGDLIVRVGGSAVAALETGDVTRRLRGPPDSTVTVDLQRPGGSPYSVTLKRMDWEKLYPGLAY